MTVTSDVLIDFGLNMAGYVVVGVLIYVLTTLRARRHMHSSAATAGETAEIIRVTDKRERPAETSVAASEYVSLAGTRKERDTTPRAIPTAETTRPIPADRRRNRQAIYEEARRLLAAGSTHADVVKRLPITEGEADMLSAIGQA